MNSQLINHPSRPYIEAFGQGNTITSEQDALDWVALCGEEKTDRLLLNLGCLNQDFYRLSTGLAGAVLLKFSNYRLKVAAISTPELVNQGKFQDMALETNRGSAFRIFYDYDQAVRWLVQD